MPPTMATVWTFLLIHVGVILVVTAYYSLGAALAPGLAERSRDRFARRPWLPILIGVAVRTGISPSATLIPMGFASILGGMATTIGTSTNLLVVNVAADMGMDAFNMFDFLGPVLVAGVLAVLYLWLVAPRLIPNRNPPMNRGGKNQQQRGQKNQGGIKQLVLEDPLASSKMAIPYGNTMKKIGAAEYER